MNPNGKSFVCILHEYVQHALKKQPTYEFKELENSATPYSATVSINNLKYGVGFGTSKKQAKSEAARETLEVLIPEMKEKITGLDKNQAVVTASNMSKSSTAPPAQDLSVFGKLKYILKKSQNVFISSSKQTKFALKTHEFLSFARKQRNHHRTASC